MNRRVVVATIAVTLAGLVAAIVIKSIRQYVTFRSSIDSFTRFRQGASWDAGAPAIDLKGNAIFSTPMTGSGDIVSRDASGKLCTLIGGESFETHPSLNSNDKQLLFTRERGWVRETWMLDALNGTETQMTVLEDARDLFPRFVQSDQLIIVQRERWLGALGTSLELLTIDPKTGAETSLGVDSEDWHEKTGKLCGTIFRKRTNRSEVWLLKNNQVSKEFIGPGYLPRFTNDGNHIAFVTEDGIMIYDITSKATQLAFSQKQVLAPVSFSRDGLYFYVSFQRGSVAQVCIVSLLDYRLVSTHETWEIDRSWDVSK